MWRSLARSLLIEGVQVFISFLWCVISTTCLHLHVLIQNMAAAVVIKRLSTSNIDIFHCRQLTEKRKIILYWQVSQLTHEIVSPHPHTKCVLVMCIYIFFKFIVVYSMTSHFFEEMGNISGSVESDYRKDILYSYNIHRNNSEIHNLPWFHYIWKDISLYGSI